MTARNPVTHKPDSTREDASASSLNYDRHNDIPQFAYTDWDQHDPEAEPYPDEAYDEYDEHEDVHDSPPSRLRLVLLIAFLLVLAFLIVYVVIPAAESYWRSLTPRSQLPPPMQTIINLYLM